MGSSKKRKQPKKKASRSPRTTSTKKKKRSSPPAGTSGTTESVPSSEPSITSSEETAPTADDSLASAAESVLNEASEQGKPIEAKAPPKRGRPSNEEMARREADEEKDALKSADQERAHEIVKKLMALAARKPVEGLSAKLGGAMSVDDEETQLVAEAAELFISNRVGVKIEGDKVFDYAFYGALAFVFGRRIIAWAIVSRLKNRQERQQAQKNDDINPGTEAVREIHASAAPSVTTQPSADC